jgi:outer membrane protein assembly factor BamB
VCMPNSRMVEHSSAWRSIFSIAFSLVVWVFFATPSFATPQSESVPGLLVTPSSAVILVGENFGFSDIDETGRPISGVQWSISSSLAELQSENGEVRVEGKQPGRAVITATAHNQTASAVVSVVSDNKLPPGAIRWSLRPMPGFETLLVAQAVPTGDAPVFYSIEWSKSSNAIVRALNDSGQQLWMTHLSSTASPLTLNHTLPAPGEVFQNQTRISDHSQFILGDKGGFAGNNATDPSAYNLPVDGKSILLRATGNFSGGLVLLERGRFRDSLVNLSPGDGSEVWRFRSEGRLTKNLTANYNGHIGIVETIAKPASSALLIINVKTGQVRFRIPFPISSSTIDGFRCTDPQHNILKSVRPSLSGSVFTSDDTNIYVQVETHIESTHIEACKNKENSFDDSLALLRVTPEGEAEWKTFQHIHADGHGNFVVQPRVFAGETIPDGFGGVLAAWTYFSPHLDNGEKLHTEARLTRIGPSGQQDFTLPLLFWTKGINSLFDQNMILGEGNALYATNGPLLVRFDTQAGVLNWGRHPPTGEVKLHFSTAGGGLLISNAGRLVYFDAQGNGQDVPWTVASTNPDDIGLAQTDLFDRTPADPLQLRDVQLCWAGNFIAVEDGAPSGRGTLLYFSSQ